ncbi:PspC domain-containing protein [Limibacter armeniacum]|uniref:PspC domain-containing protein n=1 Tax=Limibacter armeniacum TaxID=466084 RepID=UPI002FE59E24
MSKLVKSNSDKILTGVCGGLARYLNIDTTLVRLGFAVAGVLGVGSPILIYFVMALIMPREDPFEMY